MSNIRRIALVLATAAFVVAAVLSLLPVTLGGGRTLCGSVFSIRDATPSTPAATSGSIFDAGSDQRTDENCVTARAHRLQLATGVGMGSVVGLVFAVIRPRHAALEPSDREAGDP